MKRVLLLCLLVFLLLSSAKSQTQGVGIGISTYSLNMSGSILDYYVTTIRILNPSDYEISAKIYFECKDCTSEIKLFGKKIAESTIDYRSIFTIDKDDLRVSPKAYGEQAPAVKVIFSPKFITKNYLRVYTPEAINFFIKIVNKKYENSFVLPYYGLFIGKRSIHGLIVANVYASSFGSLGVTPSVGTNVEANARGMPLSSFIILLCLLILIIIYIVKKVKPSKKKSR